MNRESWKREFNMKKEKMKIKAEIELKDVNTKRLNDLISRKKNHRLKIRLKGE